MAAVANIQELLGGELVADRRASRLELVRQARKGLPPVAVEDVLLTTHLRSPAIEAYAVPRRTFNHRRDAGQQAMIWLGRPNRVLSGEAPLSLADTDIGSQRVERSLCRIAHGPAA
ncbi:MAG: hypothetical protein C0481_02325 [Phenylobacterium sp.]|uniref:antitoxin Xre/MbcA/ParS toxin-binding domain-containing protein n=1 Tax=Phenylobacterium sp. TaxID=1871053 RepID=UPI0025E2FF96|nr:antitoxin Xre/MbcA/ParS toxin-binding domain-containing protein [Phenylobacterium sp.]MBA4010680.1 hypothetical protein [Phenylobacterium sp.]